MSDQKKIGILCWEAGQVPKAIAQIASLKGSATNSASYNFPVILRRVVGANAESIVLKPSQEALDAMIIEMKKMVQNEQACAIATSCGFNAIHQSRLADEVDVPVFTSSLMQVPFIKKMLKKNQAVGVLTARKKSLSERHFQQAGISKDISFFVLGMEEYPEWSKLLVSSHEDPEINIDDMAEEICQASLYMLKTHQNIGAFVLECTDMPPFSEKIRAVTGKPVFDFITMAHYVYSSL